MESRVRRSRRPIPPEAAGRPTQLQAAGRPTQPQAAGRPAANPGRGGASRGLAPEAQ